MPPGRSMPALVMGAASADRISMAVTEENRMVTVSNQVEVTVRIGRGPAALGHLVAMMSTCGAEVLVARYNWDGKGTTVRLLTDNADRTVHALEGMGLHPDAEAI